MVHEPSGSHHPGPHAPRTARRAPAGPAASSLYKPLPHPNHPAAAKPATAAQPKPATPTTAPAGKSDALGAALKDGVVSGAKLTLSPEILAGKPGVASLVLPAALAGDLATEAGKLGLSSAAKIADASAVLQGDGYAILPDGAQTARLKAGEAATFNWQVTPSADAKGGLAADVGLDLKGAGKPLTVAIGKIAAPAPSSDAQSGAPAGGSVVDKLGVPGSPTVVVPGVGPVKSGLLVLLFIGLLIAVLAIALYNRAQSEQRAADRRRREKLRDEQEEREREERERETAAADHTPPEGV